MLIQWRQSWSYLWIMFFCSC